VVDLPEEEECVVAPALEDHEDGDVQFDYILRLRVVSVAFPLVLACDDVIEFLERVQEGLLAAIGHVLADAEVRLVGVDVGGVRGQGTAWREEYFSAYLYLPALKNWYACSIIRIIISHSITHHPCTHRHQRNELRYFSYSAREVRHYFRRLTLCRPVRLDKLRRFSLRWAMLSPSWLAARLLYWLVLQWDFSLLIGLRGTKFRRLSPLLLLVILCRIELESSRTCL
jgi:hypothetical protein